MTPCHCSRAFGGCYRHGWNPVSIAEQVERICQAVIKRFFDEMAVAAGFGDIEFKWKSDVDYALPPII